MALGMKSVEKAVERSETRTGDGRYLPSIYWVDDKKAGGDEHHKIVRFLTDEVLTAGFYNFVKGGPVVDGKQRGRDFIAPESLVKDVEDPDTGEVIHENVPLWPEVAEERNYFTHNNIKLPTYKGDIKPAKIGERTVGIAVLREEKKIDGRMRVVDKVVKREWKDDEGKEHSEEGLVFGTIKESHKLFWSTLVGYFNRYGTICDRDYEIIRRGEKLETTYVIMPMDKDASLDDLDTVEKTKAKYWAEVKTERDEYEEVEVLVPGQLSDGKCPMNLKDWALPKAKYDNAKEWLEGSSSGNEEKKGDSSESKESKPAASKEEPKDDDHEKVRESGSSTTKSLREELEGYAR